jgi:hypothetical protein
MKADPDAGLHPNFQPQALISPLAWDPNARPSLTAYVFHPCFSAGSSCQPLASERSEPWLDMKKESSGCLSELPSTPVQHWKAHRFRSARGKSDGRLSSKFSSVIRRACSGCLLLSAREFATSGKVCLLLSAREFATSGKVPLLLSAREFATSGKVSASACGRVTRLQKPDRSVSLSPFFVYLPLSPIPMEDSSSSYFASADPSPPRPACMDMHRDMPWSQPYVLCICEHSCIHQCQHQSPDHGYLCEAHTA